MDYLSNKKWIIYTLYFMSQQLLRSFPIFSRHWTLLLKMAAANTGRMIGQETDQVNK
jgi:hypothetical protein